MINENLYDKNGGLIFTHVSQIIHSTTLDTEEKVKAIYGGVRWQKIEGRFLLGQSNDYAINGEGGESTHVLSVEEMPQHSHEYKYVNLNTGARFNTSHMRQDCRDYYSDIISLTYNTTAGYSGNGFVTIDNTGSSQPHNNMPPYKTVYIWERTE